MSETNGMNDLAGGTRALLQAVRAEGAGEQVTAAAQALEGTLGLSDSDDLEAPISRIAFSTYGQSGVRLDILSVEDLMDENGEFEDSAWQWIDQLLRTKLYDDSDLRSGVLVIYMTDDQERLRAQARAWAKANPEIVGAKDLDLLILEEPTR
ncbi:hypothetical protein [Miltoncostaea oceani]|uniref:hypothetical protein n=1 Tax=Miltoncostaea oceani TaxID=2843216 RepID=UPI001C3C2D09|nr:hypothetical protein [Miltoncostaea oceani]